MSNVDTTAPDDDAIDRIVERWAAQLPDTAEVLVLAAELLEMPAEALRRLRDVDPPLDARLMAALDARIKYLEGK